ncbi:MAG TPA: hypothetical protein QGF58_14980 [Myxococcota bacterium]|nr:hypothetical protein [Myxococcota bacterium]
MILLLACSQEPDLVTLSGVVAGSREDDDVGASEILVETLGPTYEAVDDAATDGRGYFEVQVIGSTLMYVTFSGDDFAATGFTGVVGAEDYAVDDGILFMKTDDEVAALDAQYAGCPYVEEEGVGLVEGEVRYHLPGYEVDDGEWPLAGNAYAWLTDEGGTTWDACYLDGETGLYDPDAEVTGDTGRIAIFGAFSGPATLTVGYEIEGEPYYATEYMVHVPEGGIAPIYPAYVPLPG